MDGCKDEKFGKLMTRSACHAATRKQGPHFEILMPIVSAVDRTAKKKQQTYIITSHVIQGKSPFVYHVTGLLLTCFYLHCSWFPTKRRNHEHKHIWGNTSPNARCKVIGNAKDCGILAIASPLSRRVPLFHTSWSLYIGHIVRSSLFSKEVGI